MSDIPPYHKVTYQCDKCGLKEEDPQIYHYVNKEYDFLIDNLEPALKDWKCPIHPDATVNGMTTEITTEGVHFMSSNQIDKSRNKDSRF
jgi:hypothetical protein